MEIRVEDRRLIGRLRETWLENVEADMAELKIDREDIRDGKKWRRNVMKKEEVQPYRKTDYKPVIIIIILFKTQYLYDKVAVIFLLMVI